MAKRIITDLSDLDWDDDDLIKEYNEGLSLKGKNSMEEFDNEDKERKEESEPSWKAGDFCRAIYPGDKLTYEGQIVEIFENKYLVDFLGYNEDVELDFDSLSKSKGKSARQKQIENAKKVELPCSKDGSGPSTDNSLSDHDNSDSHSLSQQEDSHVINHSANYAAAENTFHNSMYPSSTPKYNVTSPPPVLMPPAPMFTGSGLAQEGRRAPGKPHERGSGLMQSPYVVSRRGRALRSAGPQATAYVRPTLGPGLTGLDVTQNASMSSMLSSWYMAGYYTGYYQASRIQSNHCCCRSGQNYSH